MRAGEPRRDHCRRATRARAKVDGVVWRAAGVEGGGERRQVYVDGFVPLPAPGGGGEVHTGDDAVDAPGPAPQEDVGGVARAGLGGVVLEPLEGAFAGPHTVFTVWRR